MRSAGWRRGGGLLLAVLEVACSGAAASRGRERRADFFPLAPHSRWEYIVRRRAGRETFRFEATVSKDEFHAADGRACRVVDERYTDVGDAARFPVVYCTEGGFLHRMMSLEYRGEALADNGLRSGEVKFLPTDLGHAHTWEGRTSAYRLPDGSGFEVRHLHEVLPAPEDVTVPAGTFAACARVETTAVHSAIDVEGAPVGPRIVYRYSDWYAPGVGLVRTEQRSDQSEVLATIELVEYEIGAETAVP
jgi:hypothetical protein